MCPKSPEYSGNWGLMGGIFDPIHYGHLLLAESARAAFDLAAVMFVVSCDPPHRENKPVASFDTRLKMVTAAIDDNDCFVASDMEKDMKIPSYTNNVVDELMKKYPDIKWHLILGADNVALFDSWYRPDELIAKVHVVMAGRPGYERTGNRSPWIEKVTRFEMPPMDISSTDIRRRLKEGRSIRYLVPENVRRMIAAEGLYR